MKSFRLKPEYKELAASFENANLCAPSKHRWQNEKVGWVEQWTGQVTLCKDRVDPENTFCPI